MATVKKKEHEKLSDDNIKKVISLLEPDTGAPITKKEACEILNISYNTTRLNKIIQEYKNKQIILLRQKELNKGKKATTEEIRQAIVEYLQGTPISEIAERLFRSSGFVKSIIEKVGVPQRPTNTEARAKVAFLPDQCMADSFSIKEMVWSAKYHTTAVIVDEMSVEKQKNYKGVKVLDYEEKYGSKCYNIYVTEPVDSSDTFFPYVIKGGFYAYALAYDLGKLSHLEQFGVDLTKI